MNKFEDLINKVDRKGLEASIDSLKAVLSSPDGQKIRDKIKNMDKKALLHKLNNMNTQDIPSSQKINDATKDPKLINKLNSFLDDNR